MGTRAAVEEWSISRVGYMWIFDWILGLIFPRIRGFYSDFFVDGRSRACSGGVEVNLAKSMFQVDLALAVLRFMILVLLFGGFGMAALYVIPGSAGVAVGEGSSIGVDLGLSYAGALGAVSAVEYLRALRLEKVSSPEVLFRSLSRATQLSIFSAGAFLSYLFILLAS